MNERQGSPILVDEFFATGDARFLAEVLSVVHDKKLMELGPRWLADKRPFARRALLAYIDDGCDRPHHRGIVKRIFKGAEAAKDDELMAHFLCAFDRLTVRAIKGRHMRLPSTGRWGEVKSLVDVTSAIGRVRPPQNLTPKQGINPFTRQPITITPKPWKSQVGDVTRFSRLTRRYLMRRAWRYFRKLGHTDPARHGRVIRQALVLYTEENLATVEQVLSAWGLLHALYGRSKIFVRKPSGVQVADGKSLADLAPAPHFPDAWRGVLDEMLVLVAHGNSRTVRSFAASWLRAEYKTELTGMTLGTVAALLKSGHEEGELLGAELLKTARDAEKLALADWLSLLEIANIDVLARVTEAIRANVSSSRLSFEQCIALACAEAAPVAELGLSWAKEKKVRNAAELTLATRLTKAKAPRVREEAAAWLASLIAAPYAKIEHVRDLIDAPHADVRKEGLALLSAERWQKEQALFFAASESPFDDVRGTLVRMASAWEKDADAASVARVMGTTLLAVHRGGREKIRAAKLLAERIVRNPDDARALLPLLAHTLRSVRPAERGPALAAIARAVVLSPDICYAVKKLMPELDVAVEATTP